MIEAPEELVVVLDASALAIGAMEKLAAHFMPGTPHLAFSVVLLDGDGRLLLQRRSDDKHHFRGRWANSCCSHPRPGEGVVEACRRRLAFELGVEAPIDLEVVGAFWYRAEDSASGLVEHEYDIVVIGRMPLGTSLAPRPDEVAEIAWLSLDDAAALAAGPDAAPWLELVLRVVRDPDPTGVVLPI